MQSFLKVSVPFPGILFLNERELDIRERELEQFPSPSRGSYFSIHRRTPDGKTINVSVPFPGILFLNMLKLEDLKSKQESFRPLPGDLISQFENWCGGTGFMRFRPLPGDLISQ